MLCTPPGSSYVLMLSKNSTCAALHILSVNCKSFWSENRHALWKCNVKRNSSEYV